MSASASGRVGRPPGLGKSGGRTRGTPNKRTLLIREKLAELGCDPVAELLKIARDPKTDVGQQMHIFSLLVKYTHPLPRPIETPDDEDRADEPEITLHDALEWAHYMINRFGSSAPKEEDDMVQEPNATELKTEEDSESQT